MARTVRDRLTLAVLALAWLGGGFFAVQNLAFVLPDAIRRELSEPSYFALTWLAVTLVAVAAAFALLDKPKDDLGLVRPTVGATTIAAFVAPLLLAVSLYLAWKIALPTLQQELAERGRQAVRASVSSANRAARQGNTATILAWTVVIAPFVEELLFRGAIWSAVTRVSERMIQPRGRSLPPEFVSDAVFPRLMTALGRSFASGGIATVATATLFAWLHVEGAGGAAMVAFTQTLCLGLAAGMARHLSGSVWPAMVVHALFNGLTLATKRGWFAGPMWPLPLPIPLRLWRFALAAAAIAVSVLVIMSLSRRVSARARRAPADDG